MKIFPLKYCVLLGTVLIGVCLTLPAGAQSHGHGSGAHYSSGHFNGGSRGGGWYRGGPGWWGLGLGLGLGWDASYYGDPYAGYPGYYSPYDPSAMIDEPLQRPVPPEGNATPPNPSSASNWYYCYSSKGYYPYVSQCPEGWRLIPTIPPGTAQ